MKWVYTLFFALCAVFTAFAQEKAERPSPIPGQLILQLAGGYSAAEVVDWWNKNRTAQGVELQAARQLSRRGNIHLLTYEPADADSEGLLQDLNRLPGVLYAHHNFALEERNTPNDPRFDQQWDMEIINAAGIWDITTGGVTALGDTIVVAVVDSGFDIEHPDLVDNVWRNRAEIPGDGVDNDGNQYVDDVVGWNFIADTNTLPITPHGHSVAGIVGARGNNGLGVTGVNWNVKLILLASTQVDHVISAYEYVIDLRERYNASNGAEGAFVVATNASFGKSRTFCDQLPAWGNMYDLLGAVGILTGAGAANSPYDVEIDGDMPTTCPSDFLINVLNTTQDDQVAQTSAYGAVSIDMGSPGDGSYTIKTNDGYGEFGGNSAAAPHLTGAIALLYSLPCDNLALSAISQPAQTALRIREALISSVDPIPALASKTATGGRLNIFNSLAILQEDCGATTGNLDITRIYPVPPQDDLYIEIETPDFEEGYQLRIYNALGQLMASREFAPLRFGPKVERFDVSHWSRGVYFVILQNGKSFQSGSFLR